jgi:hypothetical protein
MSVGFGITFIGLLTHRYIVDLPCIEACSITISNAITGICIANSLSGSEDVTSGTVLSVPLSTPLATIQYHHGEC